MSLVLLFLCIIYCYSRTPIFIAAPPTAFSEDGAVNLSVILDQALLLTDNKIDGVFVTGTTGESLSLTIDERKSILDTWIATKKSTPYPLKIIMHVGTESLENANTLAHYAEKAGADAIGSMPPTFFKCPDAVTLAESMAVTTKGVNLPFFYYHIPSMTGVTVKMIDFIPEALKRIPTFQGVKYTDYSLYDFGLCVQYVEALKARGGRTVEMLFGHDEMMVGAYLFGAHGFVGSTYNFFGNYYHGIIDAFNNGNTTLAWNLQAKSQLMVKAMLAPAGATPGAKAIMKIKGVDVGPCRLPLVAVTKEQQDVLEQQLKQLGFL